MNRTENEKKEYHANQGGVTLNTNGLLLQKIDVDFHVKTGVQWY